MHMLTHRHTLARRWVGVWVWVCGCGSVWVCERLCVCVQVRPLAWAAVAVPVWTEALAAAAPGGGGGGGGKKGAAAGAAGGEEWAAAVAEARAAARAVRWGRMPPFSPTHAFSRSLSLSLRIQCSVTHSVARVEF